MKKIVYLSHEWVMELNKVAQSHKGLNEAMANIKLVVEYRVIDEKIFVWQININKGRVEIYVGKNYEPDVWFETDRPAAVSLFEGRTNPLNEIIDGTMQIGGDPRKLFVASEILKNLEDVFEEIRAITITDIE
ncbi:MAG: hypothetical protein CL430_04855 [Acidimicrobiaceae bacterium]|nr:hypothetical protein [Acidimicrobiaceae bacterium]MDP6894233.1 SCP2 sterol-binding domain-containing protein [Acidimicrobiales bacterium]